MKTIIQCFVLLACTSIYTSATIRGCRCARTNKNVRVPLVADAVEIDPRPYCNKKEVIVTLKDKSLICLDPNENFTKLLLKAIQMQKKMRKNAAKMNTTSSITTTAPPSVPNTEPTTASTTALPTSLPTSP